MGRKKQYIVALSDEEREELEGIVKQGYHAARVIRRAQTILWCDGGKEDKVIADLVNVTLATVSNTRQKWVKEKTIVDKARSGRPPLLDGKQEAFLVALACSDAPEGLENWTMQLLAERLVELKLVANISDETVRLRLKKTR
jgi:transposase